MAAFVKCLYQYRQRKVKRASTCNSHSQVEIVVTCPRISKRRHYHPHPQPPSPYLCCKRIELIKNGGFETLGSGGSTFEHWAENTPGGSFIGIGPADEGRQSAGIINPVSTGTVKARIYQHIPVIPYCYYRLSFAERLQPFILTATPWIPEETLFTGRLYYGDVHNPAIQVDLLNISIDGLAVPSGDAFKWHETIADKPVPSYISSAIVEFSLTTRNSPIVVEWDVDCVSLRADPV